MKLYEILYEVSIQVEAKNETEACDAAIDVLMDGAWDLADLLRVEVLDEMEDEDYEE